MGRFARRSSSATIARSSKERATAAANPHHPSAALDIGRVFRGFATHRRYCIASVSSMSVRYLSLRLRRCVANRAGDGVGVLIPHGYGFVICGDDGDHLL
jgi:hypothetical protein